MPSSISRAWEELRWVIRVSRPRFWLYLFGPYLIGMAAAVRVGAYPADYPFFERLQELRQVGALILHVLFTGLPRLFFEDPLVALEIIGLALLVLGYPLLPGNLFIYGVNDIFDIETDRLNPKKDGYELRLAPAKRVRLLIWIVVMQLPWLGVGVASLFIDQPASLLRPALVVAAFLFLGIFYSAPPIRAKARPFLDSAFNILYLLPGLFTYFGLLDPDSIVTRVPFPWLAFLAGAFWCMAMHAYSAVPDIKVDWGANLQTIATRLGARHTLWLCLFLYMGAMILACASSSNLGLRAVFLVLGAIYVFMMHYSLRHQDRLPSLYRFFPWINSLSGLVLFFALLLA